MMRLTTIGLNYQTAPVAIRERLAFSAEILPHAVRDLADTAAAEALILSTCNRTELYCVGNAEQIITWWANYHGLPEHEIRPYLYVHGCSETIRHAFRVACGLDSMVLGEPQILGQMKNALRIAEQEDCLGTWLNGLFQKTFATAKEVRSHTSVGDNTVSMASAAVKMAEQQFGDLSTRNMLFVGAGEMIELVATYFAAKQPKQIAIANRSLGRAENLGERLNIAAQIHLLSELPEILADYDVIIASTASSLPIIDKEMVQNAMLQRQHSPVFMLDLAVPRDIDAPVGEIAGVHLHTVDDISAVVESGKALRQEAAAAAERMVGQKVAEFISWQQSRQRVPLICALRNEGERARRQVLDNAMKQLARGASPEEVLERLSVQLTNKLLHAPTRLLNKGENADLVDAVSEIYHLPQHTRVA